MLLATSGSGLNFSRPRLRDLGANGSLSPCGTPAPAADPTVATDTNIAIVSCNAPGRTVLLDPNPAAPSQQRYKAIGCFSNNGSADSGFPHGGKDLKVMYSSDGKSFSKAETILSAHVPYLGAHDGLANIVWDSNMDGRKGGGYMIFLRTYHLAQDVKLQSRRLSRMVSKSAAFGGADAWEEPVEVASGESGYEIYELRPWRLEAWRPGLYYGVGMYYADAEPSGKVYCELLTSPNWGRNWTRLAPHREFIPHGPAGSFDDHTCYAATPFAVDGSKELQYFFSGGNGPHNGVQTPGGVHVRDDAIALARGSADAVAGLAHPDPAAWGSFVTEEVEVTHESLWVSLGATPGGAGQPQVNVELRRRGAALAGFAGSAASCAGTPCRAEVSWPAQEGAALAALAGQRVEVAVSFRGCAVYSLGFGAGE